MFSETVSYKWVGSILIGRLFPTGALRISRNGDARTYYGHSQRDALTLFRREFPARPVGGVA